MLVIAVLGKHGKNAAPQVVVVLVLLVVGGLFVVNVTGCYYRSRSLW